VELTETRGMELGGVKISVEVPSWFAWRPSGDLGHVVCSPRDAELHVGVRPLVERPRVESPIAYPYAGGTLEVGRSGEDWVLSVRNDYCYERVARFDSSFTQGEVMVSRESIEQRACPISRPLDSGIAAHRAVLNGSLVVWGSAAVRDGRAILFLGDERPSAPRGTLARGWIVLRPEAFGSVRVSSLTFAPGSRTVRDAALHAIHVSESMFDCGPVPDCLDEESAAGELLRYAFAPAGGARVAEPILETASALARCVPVVRLGLASARRFAWRPGPTGVLATVSD
jgi:hypothetical protein